MPLGKRVINGSQNYALQPIKYPYAHLVYTQSKKNMWTPEEIAVGEDVKSFNHDLTEAERHAFVHVFAQLSTMDSQAIDILSELGAMFTSPEHKLAMASQVYQEAIHSDSYMYAADHINLDSKWLWSRWKDVPAIKAKIDYANKIMCSNLDLIIRYAFMSCIFEGVWFLGGFNPILALSNNGKLKRVSELLQYIARDEAVHVNFGISTIKTIVAEEDLDLEDYQSKLCEIFDKSLELELSYIEYVFSKGGYLGYSVEDHMNNALYLTNISAFKLGIEFDSKFSIKHDGRFESKKLVWIDEALNLKKEKNFFETRVLEYQVGNDMQWDGNLRSAPITHPEWDDPCKKK